jgi:hypothetical protein
MATLIPRSQVSIVRPIVLFVVALGTIPLLCPSASASVVLNSGTADFSQATHSPDNSVNGIMFGNDTGWAIHPNYGVDHVAAWNTASPTTASTLSFTLYHSFGFPYEVLGDFRISVTNGGTVDGNDQSATSISALTWTQLTPLTATSASGRTMAIQGNNSILVSGDPSFFDILTVTANNVVSGITAIRLEALADGSLPAGGPGRAGGNFVLTEITLDVPEPASMSAILLIGGAACVARRRRSA